MAMKTAMLLAPLTYSFFLYMVTNNFLVLGITVFIAFIIAAVTTAVIGSVQIFGTGLNASGTIIAFILIFGAGFYGISTLASNQGVLSTQPLLDWFRYGIFAFFIDRTPSGRGSPPNTIANSMVLMDYPFKMYVDIILGIMYALGLYLLVAERGGGD